ncbi:MAG TPA: hypothetical protein VKZ87_11640 [Ferrovibrio sp.]|uniref:hypothetical protein n=1 Tax=Ferrovibrio sp. TaxID=1917215 RepID=UPI002B4B490C|nr:hypothetical protein [Ferrovibrio sp.]HLT78031.1 hypothetical protein [Ferrovibrio sp.]
MVTAPAIFRSPCSSSAGIRVSRRSKRRRLSAGATAFLVTVLLAAGFFAAAFFVAVFSVAVVFLAADAFLVTDAFAAFFFAGALPFAVFTAGFPRDTAFRGFALPVFPVAFVFFFAAAAITAHSPDESA